MLLAIVSIDYAVLALYLLAMIGVGFYFSGEQRTSRDFFLAGRSMGWFPLGLSVLATLLSAVGYTGIPGEAYYVGYKFLLVPLAIWLTLPVVSLVVIPLYHRLGIYTIYEYLEMRYDLATRLLSSFLFVIWRLLWMAGVLYAPCKVLIVAGGLRIETWSLLLILGAVGTFYTFLGGMKAVIWTDVIQVCVMAAALVLVIGGVWYQLDGGPMRVAEITRELGRSTIVDPSVDLSRKWSLWGILPHFLLAFLSFFVADQVTVQRYLTARNLQAAKRSFLLSCVGVTIMVPALMYTGTALLAFFHDHPGALRPIWVANVDHRTGESLGDADGVPLIPWQHDAITAENIEQLVAEGRLLRPNTQRPFSDASSLVVVEGDRKQVDVGRLAMRQPRLEGTERGEVILHRSAQDELLPHFISSQLPRGLCGLVLAALLAASMSSIDSQLNSVCTLLMTDFHRRLGIGRAALARYLNKPIGELNEADEMWIGRPLVLIVGVAATLFSLIVARVDDLFTIMIAIVNTFGGPLLAVFLLGIFSRRTTATAAIWTLAAGTLCTLWLMLAHHCETLSWLWFWDFRLNGIWPLTLGVLFSLFFGYLLSLFCGRRKTEDELRGLVVGIGRLGLPEPAEASIAIPESFDLDEG